MGYWHPANVQRASWFLGDYPSLDFWKKNLVLCTNRFDNPPPHRLGHKKNDFYCVFLAILSIFFFKKMS